MHGNNHYELFYLNITIFKCIMLEIIYRLPDARYIFGCTDVYISCQDTIFRLTVCWWLFGLCADMSRFPLCRRYVLDM